MSNIEQRQFPNYGYSVAKLPDDIALSLKTEIENIQKSFSDIDKIEKGLAGHLEKQYRLINSKEIIEPFLVNMAIEYIMAWNYSEKISKKYRTKGSPFNFTLDGIWVNFQQKHEFNPLHDHDGVFSFVCWANIPYDIKEELVQPSVVTSNSPMPTAFSFVYTDVLGEITILPFLVEKQHEWNILFFPAELKHLVHPFLTSDDYRITVAGNLILQQNA